MKNIELWQLMTLLLSLLCAMLLEAMALPRVIYIARKKGFYDMPNKRKSHAQPIPRIAGVTFLPIMILVLLVVLLALSWYKSWAINWFVMSLFPKLAGFVGGGILLGFVGIKDDLVGSRYRNKMIVQFVAACLMVMGGVYINDFNGLFGLHEIPAWAGIPFTVLLTVFITNSINLIDGADGLASGIAGVAFVSLGILFLYKGMFFNALICIILLGVLIPFFYYNVFNTRRKVFMGDTGSLTLGFVLAYLGVRFAMTTPEMKGHVECPVMIALSALFIPLFDALRVMLERAFEGKPMFLPDRRHIHHKLLDMGFTHRKVMVSIVACALLLVLLNLWMVQVMDINLVFAIDIASWLLLVWFAGRKKR